MILRSFATKLRVSMLAAGILGLASVTALASSDTAGPPSPAPTGYVKYLVYIANGVYNPNDPTFVAPTGDYFLHTVMGFNDQQIAAWRAKLTTFFQQRFGLDFSQGDTSNNVSITGTFMFDPRNNYRAHTISGMFVPSEGFVVRDGGWQVVVGPGGAVLHGTYGGAQGKLVPEGAVMVYGFYNILVEPTSATASGSNSHQPPPPPIILHYQSHTPTGLRDVSGNSSFQCQLIGINPDVGAGFAQGFSGAPLQNPDGTINVDIRNVLTFPGY